jgi:hypothetical protein
MSLLPKQFKTNVIIGLSFATFTIFVYNKYDDIPSFTDLKKNIKTRFANYLFSNSLLDFSDNKTTPLDDNTGKNGDLSPIKEDNENLEEAI